ncbi:MAG: response regulator [gamma proteobacterium symbiont of Lucinoma myriamae]|nr:response regulator [gamma proteobacterium symbiont of Lucinoma myriamae]
MHTHKFGGTGLGTTIAKQLVEFMGGEIGLSSVLGTGSHFWFTLSLPVIKDDDMKDRYHHIFTDKRAAILVCKNVLYESLESYCQFFGFTVERFYSESELLNGLQQAVKHEQPFELVILSTGREKNMPVELANKMNALDFSPYSAPKKVFLNYLDKRSEAQKLGGALFDCYITKPVNFERFGDELSTLLNPDSAQVAKNKCYDFNNVSLNILIAEDEDINAMVLSSFLQDAGHKTKRVLNGAQAVEELAQNTYDMAFMDMRMPEMNGTEATIAWRAHEPEGVHIPIIALTANATKDDRKSCLEAGMDDFITKPITPEQLSRAIVKFCLPGQ